jgi:aminoglycoside phosphotransferase (APT) family kinase protein
MVAAAGVRITWSELPFHVRAEVEKIIGGTVVDARSQTGGFSPGTADRVRTADGRRAFVKAVTSVRNEQSAVMARQELRITGALPAAAPVPRLLGGFDDGEWVALVLEDVEGTHPRTPWVQPEIDMAAAALRELAAVLTPAPLAGLPSAADMLADDFAGWDRIAAGCPPDLEPWTVRRLDDLRAAARRSLTWLAAGDTLSHCDIRADNLLIRPDGRVVVIDWPWGCRGPAWLDTVLLAINVIVHGGDPRQVLTTVDHDAVLAVVAGVTGYFQYASRQPPPPGLPTLRAFQRFQGDALLPWLRTALDS